LDSRFRRNAELPVGSWLRDFFRPRYLALGISVFLAMYVGLKFVLVLFNAADLGERWSFELTPFAVLNLPDVQLAFLSGIAVVSNAYLHYSAHRAHRKWAILLTGSMVAGLLLALRGASADLDPVNLGRVAALVSLLAVVPLDHVDLLRTAPEAPEDFIEAELRSIAATHAAAGPVTPAAVARALQELERLVTELPETKPVSVPSPQEGSAGTADDEYMRELMTSVLGESKSDEGLSRPTKTTIQKSMPVSAPAVGEPAVKDDTDTTEGRLTHRRGRLVRSPDALLAEARVLVEQGRFEKALRRLDRVAAQDVRYPGLWELAAETYERLGEPEAAAECRRRAAESSR